MPERRLERTRAAYRGWPFKSGDIIDRAFYPSRPVCPCVNPYCREWHEHRPPTRPIAATHSIASVTIGPSADATGFPH